MQKAFWDRDLLSQAVLLLLQLRRQHFLNRFGHLHIYVHCVTLYFIMCTYFPGAFSNMKLLGVHVIKSKEMFFRSSSLINVMLQNGVCVCVC